MSPYLIVAALLLLSKKSGSPIPGRPVPPGGAVTSMTPGQSYTLTLLFRGLGPGMPTPTPDVLAASASAAPAPPSAFTVNPALTHVVQNSDGSWAAQVTGVFHGGTVTFGNAWALLQMAAAS